MIRRLSFAIDRFAERLHALARRMRGEEEPDGPYVCPGCYAVAEPCSPWCPDAAMEREREDRETWCDDDDAPDSGEMSVTVGGDSLPF